MSALAAATLLARRALAQAHHSFAMFDMSKTANWKGTVKEVQWTNPHVWIELTLTRGRQARHLEFRGRRHSGAEERRLAEGHRQGR